MLRHAQIVGAIHELRPELLVSHDPGEDEGMTIALPDLADFYSTSIGITSYEDRVEFHHWADELCIITGQFHGEADADLIGNLAILLMERVARKNKES